MFFAKLGVLKSVSIIQLIHGLNWVNHLTQSILITECTIVYYLKQTWNSIYWNWSECKLIWQVSSLNEHNIVP